LDDLLDLRLDQLDSLLGAAEVATSRELSRVSGEGLDVF
jgi:hypothetical protein